MTIYTVKRGDNLYRIAKRFGMDTAALARDNGIAHPERLSVGQTLVISEPKSVYTVREGDTLYSVAQRFSMRVRDLWRNNPFLGGTHDLRPGDVLVIVGESPAYDREISANTYVYPWVDRAELRTMLPYLTYLTVMGYGIDDDGTLIEPQDDGELVELAREYGTAPILQIAGIGGDGRFSDTLAARILSDDLAADTLMSEIETALSKKRYRGVELDFQGLPAVLGDAYASWLNTLRGRLSASGRELFVALTPCTDEKADDWYGGVQNFKSLDGASDGSRLATYGWGYAHGEPMAISPMAQVRESLSYAAGQMPPERMALGLSQYGYEWSLPFSAEEDRARAIDYPTAMELAWQKRAAIAYDDTQEAPYLRWFEREGGKTREHVAYFEDARSMAARLALIDEYGLGGLSLWNGMQYMPQFWRILSTYYPIRKIWE